MSAGPPPAKEGQPEASRGPTLARTRTTRPGSAEPPAESGRETSLYDAAVTSARAGAGSDAQAPETAAETCVLAVSSGVILHGRTLPQGCNGFATDRVTCHPVASCATFDASAETAAGDGSERMRSARAEPGYRPPAKEGQAAASRPQGQAETTPAPQGSGSAQAGCEAAASDCFARPQAGISPAERTAPACRIAVETCARAWSCPASHRREMATPQRGFKVCAMIPRGSLPMPPGKGYAGFHRSLRPGQSRGSGRKTVGRRSRHDACPPFPSRAGIRD